MNIIRKTAFGAIVLLSAFIFFSCSRISGWLATDLKPELIIQSYHAGPVSKLEFSSDGTRLASLGEDDNTIRVWDTNSGRLLNTMVAEKTRREVLSFLEEGRYLLTVGREAFSVIKLPAGDAISSYDNISLDHIYMCPKRGLFAYIEEKEGKKYIVVCDIMTKKVISKLDVGSEKIVNLKFSPGGKILLGIGMSGNIILWTVKSDGRFNSDDRHTLKYTTVKDNRLKIDFSSDGGKLVARPTNNGEPLAGGGYRNDPLVVWDTTSFETKSEAHLDMGPGIIGYLDPVFSEDLSFLVVPVMVGGGNLRIGVWDLHSGKMICLFDHIYTSEKPHLVLCEGNSRVAVWSLEDDNINLWDVKTGKLVKTLSFMREEKIIDVKAFSDKYIASASLDGVVRIWDLKREKVVNNMIGSLPSGVSGYTISDNGEKLYLTDVENLYIWDFAKGISKTVRFGYWKESNPAVSGLGKNLYSATRRSRYLQMSPSGRLFVYCDESGIEVGTFDESTGFTVIRSLSRSDLSIDGGDQISCFRFSPDEAFLGIGILPGDDGVGKRRYPFVIISLEEGEIAIKSDGAIDGGPKGDYFTTLKFSPDSRYVAVEDCPCGKPPYCEPYSRVHVWDVKEKIEVCTLNEICNFKLLGDNMIAVVEKKKKDTIKLVDFLSYRTVKEYPLKSQSIDHMILSRDRSTIVVDCRNNDTAILKINEGTLKTIKSRVYGKSLTLSSDGRLLLRKMLKDGVIIDTTTGDEIRRFPIGVEAESEHFSPGFCLRDKYALFLNYVGENALLEMWDVSKGKKALTLINFTDRNWVVTTPGGYYDCSPKASEYVAWRIGNKLFSLDQYWDRNHVPYLLYRVLNENFVAGEALDIPKPPEVKFLTPNPKDVIITTEYEQFPIRVEVTDDSDVGEVVITLNGRPLITKPEGPIEIIEDTGNSVTLSGIVKLNPGENTLTVYACDDHEARSNDKSVTVTLKGHEQKKGYLYVLVVGITNYKKMEYNLNYSAKDAVEIKDTLVRRAKPPLFLDVKPRTLTDSDATLKNINDAISSIQDEITKDDDLLIFLSGHGVKDKGYKYYFLTYEGDLKNISKTAMEWEEFKEKLGYTNARNVVLILDTCFSGCALGNSSIPTDRLSEHMLESGATVLCSSTYDKPSEEDRIIGHGIYAYGVIEGLNGKADLSIGGMADGLIYITEINTYVVDKLRRMNKSQNPGMSQCKDCPDFPIVKGE